jgi:hypothetical protein
MGGADEITLANVNVMTHLVLDIPPDPYYGRRTSGIMAGRLDRYLTCEYPGKHQMARITILLDRRDIAKNEHVEARMVGDARIDGGEREKDGP